jgi:hypothetical protein
VRAIPALLPRGPGHNFVLYGDACSGIPGHPHEANFAAINAVIRRLDPPPDFILFLGDEIAGLTADADDLRAQWRHFLDHEIAWVDCPMFHATGNHTTYDTPSESLFRDLLGMPRNGPPDQRGLSYWVRRDDLLLVFVHTLWSGLGGEGHVETDWLRATLRDHPDARHKLVVGHHPVHPINGFSGAYQREIGPEHAGPFWDILVAHNVTAYLCSHILAFDVQVHRGVLQICSAGAGTAHRMPEGIEYLHAVQAALDAGGLRYQVLDIDGNIRERLSWPPAPPPADLRQSLPPGESATPAIAGDTPIAFHASGTTAPKGTGTAQTILSAFQPGIQAPLWVGLRGADQRLTVIIGPEPRRSPHYWIGPPLPAGAPFSLQLLFHPGMGPGGIMCRIPPDQRWSSLAAASPWGAERLTWPSRWSIGHGQHGPADCPFLGRDLAVTATA